MLECVQRCYPAELQSNAIERGLNFTSYLRSHFVLTKTFKNKVFNMYKWMGTRLRSLFWVVEFILSFETNVHHFIHRNFNINQNKNDFFFPLNAPPSLVVLTFFPSWTTVHPNASLSERCPLVWRVKSPGSKYDKHPGELREFFLFVATVHGICFGGHVNVSDFISNSLALTAPWARRLLIQTSYLIATAATLTGHNINLSLLPSSYRHP